MTGLVYMSINCNVKLDIYDVLNDLGRKSGRIKNIRSIYSVYVDLYLIQGLARLKLFSFVNWTDYFIFFSSIVINKLKKENMTAAYLVAGKFLDLQ